LYTRNAANSAEVLAGNSNEFLASSSKPAQQTNSSQEKIELKREVGLFSAVNLIVGVMIGNDYFNDCLIPRVWSVNSCINIGASVRCPCFYCMVPNRIYDKIRFYIMLS
jgi:hypothetical protein